MSDLCDALIRGARRPVSFRLTTSRAPEGSDTRTGFVVGGTLILLTDPEGLQVRRAPGALHVLREGRDILRRSSGMSWVFENAGQRFDPPVRLASSDVTVPGVLSWFFDQSGLVRVIPSSLWAYGRIRPGEVVGRATWVVEDERAGPAGDAGELSCLEVDQESGVLLAVGTGRLRVEVEEITVGADVPDPAWDGAWVPYRDPHAPPPARPERATVPGSLETLPPQPEDPRRLRVFVGETELEGAFPDYRVGRSIRLPLGISSDPEPVGGLSTTRRGRVRNLGAAPFPDAEGLPRWPIELIGNGWTAQAYSPVPVRSETQVEGWFHYSAHGADAALNDVRVQRIFAGTGGLGSTRRVWREVESTSAARPDGQERIRDVVLDVTLDDVSPPPLHRDTFTGLDPVAAGGCLWLCDLHLPVARCWEIATGRYLGQVVVPAPMGEKFPVLELYSDRQCGAVAASGTHGWALTPGHAVATALPGWRPPARAEDRPAVPEPWEFTADHGGGIYEVWQAGDDGARTGLARRNARGRMEVAELPPTGFGIKSVVRIGAQYLVNRWVEEYRLNADLGIVAVERLDWDSPGWAATDSVAYCVSKGRVRLFDQTSGAEYPALEIDEGQQAAVLSAACEEMVVLVHRSNPHHSMSILPVAAATFREGAWRRMPLEEAAAEIF